MDKSRGNRYFNWNVSAKQLATNFWIEHVYDIHNLSRPSVHQSAIFSLSWCILLKMKHQSQQLSNIFLEKQILKYDTSDQNFIAPGFAASYINT